jgi:hypothetical protein
LRRSAGLTRLLRCIGGASGRGSSRPRLPGNPRSGSSRDTV